MEMLPTVNFKEHVSVPCCGAGNHLRPTDLLLKLNRDFPVSVNTLDCLRKQESRKILGTSSVMTEKYCPKDMATAVRALSMDSVEKANSGHPGAPMGMADIGQTLWTQFLKHNPKNPEWFDRDRFILSNGHGSMLLYSLLHLTGYDLSIDDLKSFRQLNSKTPGHPEYRETPGVETTTGPLGQGLANGVGFALAESHLSTRFNKDGIDIVDHHTYVFAGDGCLMEGISHEACSLAGTLGLGKLIVFYDRNKISIDGEVSGWFTDNTPLRFESYGWHVIDNVDGHNHCAISDAINEAKNVKSKPSIICCDTVIGYGSPNKSGLSDCHGSPLGPEEIEATREHLQWQHPAFFIPKHFYKAWDATEMGKKREREWKQSCKKYSKLYPSEWNDFQRILQQELPETWKTETQKTFEKIQTLEKNEATRKSSQSVLDHIAKNIPELIGGSADLTGSNNTFHQNSKSLSAKEKDGNYIFYGVREFAMTAIMNGLALHGGVIPYAGTFLVFSDYARNAIRMAALMQIRSILVYTHDSIGLGEDGPTHQPVEHLNSLRIIPNLDVWRPCDRSETAVAWFRAIERKDGPSCIVLTRQAVPQQGESLRSLDDIKTGGYILLEPEKKAEALIVATGSEIALAMEIAIHLNKSGSAIRLISMPCESQFQRQDVTYKNHIFSDRITKRVAIEASTTSFWFKYVGTDGLVIGLDEFGASAPASDLFVKYGLDFESCLTKVKNYLKK